VQSSALPCSPVRRRWLEIVVEIAMQLDVERSGIRITLGDGE
jgi:hypothetical protein